MPFIAKRLQRSKQLDAAAKGFAPLKKFSKGEGVEIFQQALIDLGFPLPKSTAAKSLPDGDFGSETDAAAKAFQRDNGLFVDGIIGPQTLGRMDQLCTRREIFAQAQIFAEASAPDPICPWYTT